MKRALVTGAAGFIGSHLCTRLLEDEIEVIGIDGSPTTEKLDYIGRNANFELINERIEQVDLSKLMHRVDVIFHLACGIQPNEQWKDIEAKVKEHVHYLRLLAQAIEGGKKKFVFSSSYDVYGKKTGEVTENSAANPQTMYGLIKLTEENYIRMAAAKKQFPYVILRFPTVYGPWQPEEMTFQQIINADEGARKIRTLKKDSVTEDAIYVEDAVQALCLAAEHESRNVIYNIGSGTSGEWRKGLKLLSVRDDEIPHEKRNMVVLGEKAAKELGFRSGVKIEEGLEKQIQHSKQRLKNRFKT
ncbi:NAD-dependent epimerase/dehydratase family protein [Fictibacillus terranigra]|uniref:NAD(P)-dependent oxidoreductase n=1 Tax=Fictibacillus terranigra TaxID=3058424 RepID=A0ABT8E722_9BACL|nr:NAD(P)-dependent oxidoreductase [Fictibacillus sp. CENA-BCM004]MDN4073708.1 NAD(P)-dependent oxidoreductase [Fictibacillus sp. CENA-BCM004]